MGPIARVAAGRTDRDGDVAPVGRPPDHRLLDGTRTQAFGTIGVTAAGNPSGPASSTGLACDRVHVSGRRGICLRRTVAPRYAIRVLDERLGVTAEISLIGLPSRTRVSHDGRYGAVTAFSRGHSYARPGQFSTTTSIVDLGTATVIGELEQFTVTRSGTAFRSIDFNFWGVSFVPSDANRFVATLATRGTTYLVQGDIGARRMEVLHENVECPSLSPDGTRVGYKKRVGGPGEWRFHVLDLATGSERALAETRSIDDQLEWLDDDTLMYGFAEDIWVVAANGDGPPRVLVDGGDSPALWRRPSA